MQKAGAPLDLIRWLFDFSTAWSQNVRIEGFRIATWRCSACRYNPELLPEISKSSGVKIVAGTAYYVDPFIPSAVRSMTVEQVSS